MNKSAPLFTAEYLSFFEELASNNHKEWFDQNRKRYETHVKKPFYKLVELIIDSIKETDNTIQTDPKKLIFRINRDIRFSKDKQPYKLHMAAVFSHHGRKKMDDPGMYIHLGLDNFTIGGGLYYPQKEILQKMRQSIVDNEKILQRILEDKAFKDLYGGFAPCEKNKILPSEFKSAATNIPLLYNKSFFYMKQYSNKEILKPDFFDFIIKHYQIGEKLNAFIRESID